MATEDKLSSLINFCFLFSCYFYHRFLRTVIFIVMKQNSRKVTSPLIRHNFDKFWRYFPVARPLKEEAKGFLFTVSPFLFRRLEMYHNWKNARIFKNFSLSVWNKDYWKRKIGNTYTIDIPVSNNPGIEKPQHQKLAVVVHVFYPEVFSEILQFLSKCEKVQISLYITGPFLVLEQVKPLVRGFFKEAKFMAANNHGRDILPFLKILPNIFDDGHSIVLKLHTKQSNHLNRKEHWRNDLLNKLIGRGSIVNAMQIFRQNPQVGMIGPSGNILPMYLYYAANAGKVRILSTQMGVADKQLSDLNFVAGSMFYARKEVLKPILDLQLSDADFETESGQTDGTMAHVVERLFAAGLIVPDLYLADTDYSENAPILTVTKNHYFTI